MEQYKAGRCSIGDRRILIIYWVTYAWKKVHKERKGTIIKTFRQVGLSLNPNGSENSKLKIKDLLGIVISDYNRPTIISNDDNEMGNIIKI
jgi:hypothetical protein